MQVYASHLDQRAHAISHLTEDLDKTCKSTAWHSIATFSGGAPGIIHRANVVNTIGQNVSCEIFPSKYHIESSNLNPNLSDNQKLIKPGKLFEFLACKIILICLITV